MTDELELLGCFADFAELSRNRPAGEDLHTELRVHSSKEHFHTYLQSLDVDRGGLPQQFRDRLARVLAHYGVTDWDRTPELEEAVFRIFLAQQRSAPEVQMATELLQRWIAEPPPREELAGSVRDLLERLVRSTQLRFPAVGDLARSTRFRWFDQPLVDAERSSVLAGVRDEVAALAADPDAPDRTARLEALAAIPEQIVRFLAERLETGVPEQEPMLEVLVRRHYREHDLHGLRSFVREGRTFAVADYVLDGRPTRVVSTVGTIAELGDPDSAMVTAVGDEVAAREAGHEVVLDLYVSLAGRPGGAGAGQRGARPHRRCPALRPRRTPGRGGGVPWRGKAGQLLHLPSPRRRRDRRGRPGPRRTPDGRPPARSVAAARLPRHPHRGARGRAPLRVRGAGEPRRPPARRPGPGPSARRRPRRGGQGHRPAPRGAGGGELPGGDPPRPCVARRGREQARHQPRVGAGVADRRGRCRAADRAAGQDHPAHRRSRDRGGARAGPGDRPRRQPLPHRDPVPRPSRRRRDGVHRGSADRAAQAARRVRRQGRPRPPPRPGLPLRARGGAHGAGGRLRRVRPRRHGCAGARRPVTRAEQGRHPGRRGHDPDRPAPGGRDPGGALRRPDEGPGGGLGARVLTDHRGHRPRGADAGALGVVRALGGRPDLDGLRHGEHGLGRGRAQADHRVHPGRRRDQRRRRGHQRRSPAVLERRGDDAHAHQGHPGHDPGQRDGADREAVARLLRRSLCRGQLRHRWLRPGDGPERSGAVLGARPGRRLRRTDGSLRPHLRRAR